MTSAAAASDTVAPAQAVDATDGKVKRKLALHLGYVGTDYRGLQWQPPHAPGASPPIENVLESALVAAGAMRPSNAGAPHKVGWSRSSRTDAGVHSLATVAGIRLEVDRSLAEHGAVLDPEGLALAASINARLPPTIRVFSAQRVPGGWDARNMCGRRDYKYYLPAALLGAEPGTDAGDAALARFRATLSSYVGNHAFHNYTVRRAYRPEAKESARNRRAGPGRRRSGSGGGAATASEDGGGEEGEEGEEGAAAASQPPSTRTPKTGPLMITPVFWPPPGPPGDKIGSAHYRRVDVAAAADPAPLIPGGPPAIEVSLEGGSFMLRQLRHMVGAAVAVARGVLPPDFPASATRPGARVNIPLAPAETLVLSHASFGAYPANATGADGAPPPWVGERLELRDGGRAAVDEFRRTTLLPALNGLCSAPVWGWWEDTLGRYAYDEVEMKAFLEAASIDAAEAAARREGRSSRQPSGSSAPPTPLPPSNLAVDLPDDCLRSIFACLPWRDRVRVALVCTSWARAARTAAPDLWESVVASRQETPAGRARRLSVEAVFHVDTAPFQPRSLPGLASFIASRHPRHLVGLRVSTVTDDLLRVVARAAAQVRTFGLRVDLADADGLAALVSALARGGAASPLTCLELLLAPAQSGRHGKPFVPPPQRDAGVTLAGLAAAVPGLTRLVFEAPYGGWAAGPLVAGLPHLVELTLRGLKAAPRLFAGARFSALTALDLVNCRRLALPTGSLAGVPLARLRIWACEPVTTEAAVRLESVAVSVRGWADPAPSAAAALDAALDGAVALLVEDGSSGDLDDLAVSDMEEDSEEFIASPFLNGVADTAPTLRSLELVETPIPGGLFDTLLPALTRLRAARIDSGYMSKHTLFMLPYDLAVHECFMHDNAQTSQTDLGPVLGGGGGGGPLSRLTELRFIGIGHAFSLAGAARPAHNLRVLDLRGAHNSTWPAGLGPACPGLTALLLGFNRNCIDNDMDEFESDHIAFDLAAPPTLQSLRRFVLVHASARLMTGAVRAAEWARQLAATHFPALTAFEVDDREEPGVRGVRAVSFIPAAYAHVRGRRGVLRLTQTGDRHFCLPGCMEDDDWHDDTDDDEYGLVGLRPDGPKGAGEEEEDDTDEEECRVLTRRMERLDEALLVPVESMTASAPQSWHGPGEACPAVAGGRCDGGLCGDRAMRARIGVAVEGRESE